MNPSETDQLPQDAAGETYTSNELEYMEAQIQAEKDKANKDMLYGALWCIGGTVLTIADIGFIFWGAIVFGAVQFVRGAIAASKI